MFPIRDTIPSQRTPVVTWALIAVNVVVFLGTAMLGRSELERLFLLGGLVPARFTDAAWAASAGLPPAGPLPVFTCMFLHGGWFHLISNMWVLWIFGDNVEGRMGHGRFVAFYLLAGVAASLAHGVINPTSTLPTVGASGAIAGVLGAYMILFPRSRVLTLIPICFYPLFVQLPATLFLGFWFVSQLLNGTAQAAAGAVGGVAWWAHIGGFVAGLGLVRWFLDPGRVSIHDPPGSTPSMVIVDEEGREIGRRWRP